MSAVLLDDVVRFVRRFVAMSPAQADAAALWVLHTHALDAAEQSPYLAVTSAEKRSGKSRLLDVLELIVARPWRVVTPSEAVIFRKLDAQRPTLLLDECDAIFHDKSNGANRRAARAAQRVEPAGYASPALRRPLAGVDGFLRFLGEGARWHSRPARYRCRPFDHDSAQAALAG